MSKINIITKSPISVGRRKQSVCRFIIKKIDINDVYVEDDIIDSSEAIKNNKITEIDNEEKNNIEKSNNINPDTNNKTSDELSEEADEEDNIDENKKNNEENDLEKEINKSTISLNKSKVLGKITFPKIIKTKRNLLTFKEYFGNESTILKKAIKTLNILSEYGYEINLETCKARLNGGGKSSQAEALNLAITKYILLLLKEKSFERGIKIIRKFKLNTSDSRKVHPKLSGLVKHRKGPQRGKR